MVGRTQQTQMFNVTVYFPLPWQHLQFIGRNRIANYSVGCGGSVGILGNKTFLKY